MKHICFILFSFFLFNVVAQPVLFPIKIKEKWGYTNMEGKMVIVAQYDYAEFFYEGRAVVALNNQPCVIDASNKRIIDTGLYINIARFSEGLAKVTDVKLRQGFVDYSGKIIFTLPADYYDARPFKNGISSVAKSVEIHQQKFGRDISNLGYKFGYINKKGEPIVDFIYEDADDCQNGFARYREGTLFGVIDSLGQIIVKPTYGNLGRFIEGKATASLNGKFGFINEQGIEIIKPVYQYAYDFSEGLAGVMVEGKFGFIDEAGMLIIPAEYEMVRPFSNGMAAVRKEGKWGFIDKTGTLKLRFVFDDALFFMEGRCAVLVKRKWGFIDLTGAMPIPAEYEAVGSFSNGLAEVMRSSVTFYVNKQGIVIPKLN